MSMGIPVSKNFGDPYCLTFAHECPAKPHLDLSTKVYKMEQSTSSLSVQIQNGKRHSVSTRGQFTFNDIHRYLHDSCYPDGYTKPDKLALRKRANFFCARGADLIYGGGSSSKFLPSTYVHVCAFVGTFLSLRPFYTIERDVQVSERLVVEDHQRKHIIANVYDSSHLGVNRTLDMMTAKCYCPGLTQDVKKYASYLVQGPQPGFGCTA